MQKLFILLGLSLVIGTTAMAQESKPTGKKSTPAQVKTGSDGEKYDKEKAAAAMAKAKAAAQPAATTNTTPDKKGAKGFHPPQFPGGQAKLDEFLKTNLKYPAKAAKERIEGDVFVKFTVRKDGTVMIPKVISGLEPECDKEALRLLSIMPKWEPGQKDDEIIEAQYTMYVHFVLD